MEMKLLLPKPTYGGIKKYLRKHRYQRLNRGTTTGRRRKMEVIRLRGGPVHKQWKIGRILRLKWVMRSPLKMLTKFKNAYMNFMLRLAGNVRALNTDNNISSVKRIPKGRQGSKKVYSGDAFEARLIFEISKTLIASNELYPM